MYCPKCAAPIDGVKFCRHCGTNVSLVPQALTGQLPVPTDTTPSVMQNMDKYHGRRHRRDRQAKPLEPPSMAHAFNHVIFALGFLAAAAIVMRFTPDGIGWGWVFIFPAMGAFGKAVSEYYRAAEAQQQAKSQQFQPTLMSQPIMSQAPPLQVPTTSELKLPAAAQDLAQPVSITEHTTALLDPARQKVADKN